MFGIGLEKEIYSQSYVSYHYGYRSIEQIPKRKSSSKLFEIENKIKENFTDINFQILFLNISKRGVFVNFTVKDEIERQKVRKLGIIPIRDANAFSINLKDIGGYDIPHREIFPKPNLNEYPITDQSRKIINDLNSRFTTVFCCIGFDGYNGKLNYNDIHFELYPEKHTSGLEDFLNNLNDYKINTKPFEKYFLNFRKFSHLKFRILNDQIENIKYYRSINVNIPQFYYE